MVRTACTDPSPATAQGTVAAAVSRITSEKTGILRLTNPDLREVEKHTRSLPAWNDGRVLFSVPQDLSEGLCHPDSMNLLRPAREGLDRPKIAIIVFFVAVSVILELVVHVGLGMETVYSHFFYVPIVLAAAWMGIRGLPVSLILSALYLADTALLSGTIGPDSSIRAGMFVLVSLVIGLVSDSARRKHREAMAGTGDAEARTATARRGAFPRGDALLRHIGPPNVDRMRVERDVPGLVRALGHKDPAVQYAAAEALGELREPSAVAPLMEVLTADRYSGVRWKAAEALARIGEPAVVPLIGALHHPDEDVRWKAAIALGEIGDDRAISPLIELLGDSDRFVQSRAAYALGEFGTRAAPLLRLALANGPPPVRQGAVLALRKIRDPAALDDLTRALGDPDAIVRSAALEALMQHGGEGYRHILLYLSAAPVAERAGVFQAIRDIPNQKLLKGFVPLLSGADRKSREFILSVIDAGERHEGPGERPAGP